MSKKVSAPAPAAPAAAPAAAGAPPQATLVPTAIGVFVVFVLLCATLGIVIDNNKDISKVMDMEIAAAAASESTFLDTRSPTIFTNNYCEGAKPTDDAFNNFDCEDAVAGAIEQAGANVTEGYVGLIDNSATPPITTTYRAAGLCPVNVHWHLGAEHLSVGEYDEHGDGPHDDYELATDDGHHRLLASPARLGRRAPRLPVPPLRRDGPEVHRAVRVGALRRHDGRPDVRNPLAPLDRRRVRHPVPVPDPLLRRRLLRARRRLCDPLRRRDRARQRRRAGAGVHGRQRRGVLLPRPHQGRDLHRQRRRLVDRRRVLHRLDDGHEP